MTQAPDQAVANVPDKLSDADARKFLEQAAPRARTLSNAIAGNNARAEQGREQLAGLQVKAREFFGTDDPLEIRRILDERMTSNAQRVRAFLTDLSATEAKVQELGRAAPAR